MQSPSQPGHSRSSPELTPWRRIVAEIRTVGAPGGRTRLGKCAVEGLRLCERALRSGARIDHAVHDRAFLEDTSPRTMALRLELERTGCRLHEIPTEAFIELTEGRCLGGIVGTAALPQTRTLEEMLRGASSVARLVVCVGFNDPGNLGAIVRSAHGTGATGVITVGATGAFHPKAIRTSMGSLFRLPIIEYTARSQPPGESALEELASELHALGVRTLAAVTSGGTSLPDLTRRENPLALVFGSEAFGLEAHEVELFDERVSIPMSAGVDSFSVSAAAAMFLHELRI